MVFKGLHLSADTPHVHHALEKLERRTEEPRI
jgi:hypothetical protein